jgi:hypothetical protein
LLNLIDSHQQELELGAIRLLTPRIAYSQTAAAFNKTKNSAATTALRLRPSASANRAELLCSACFLLATRLLRPLPKRQIANPTAKGRSGSVNLWLKENETRRPVSYTLHSRRTKLGDGR